MTFMDCVLLGFFFFATCGTIITVAIWFYNEKAEEKELFNIVLQYPEIREYWANKIKAMHDLVKIRNCKKELQEKIDEYRYFPENENNELFELKQKYAQACLHEKAFMSEFKKYSTLIDSFENARFGSSKGVCWECFFGEEN